MGEELKQDSDCEIWGSCGNKDDDALLGFDALRLACSEDEDSMFLQNAGIYLRVDTASKPRRTS
jgi:hypothetical protein